MKKRKVTLKKSCIVLLVLLVVSVMTLLCHIRVLSGIEFMRDSETGEIMIGTPETVVQDSVILRLDRERIPIWGGEIGAYLEYTGNEFLVFGGWTLETRRNGTWTYLQRKPMNVNLVEIVFQNGSKETGTLKFDQYGRFLPPGEYRLGVWLGGNKSAVEFEVSWWGRTEGNDDSGVQRNTMDVNYSEEELWAEAERTYAVLKQYGIRVYGYSASLYVNAAKIIVDPRDREKLAVTQEGVPKQHYYRLLRENDPAPVYVMFEGPYTNLEN